MVIVYFVDGKASAYETIGSYCNPVPFPPDLCLFFPNQILVPHYSEPPPSPMRRDFLKLCALTGLGFACPGGLASFARAAVKEEPPYEGPFYIVFNASGGWDTTYLMDPKG